MSTPSPTHKDLTVRAEAVERVFGHYQQHRYIVNRRYQRKLVWTLEEKVNFIDSIVKGYPVPIILLAERPIPNGSLFEIIDGMQRLNAITGFIENKFPINNQYFDLNSMAVTKDLLDRSILTQQQPIMPREQCVRIASYTLPLSIYEFSNPDEVDDIFRRINSGGRKLSHQELRIAGSTGHFANSVRIISTKIRGDDSNSDELPLNEMTKISITNRALEYGINVDSIFWITQGVYTRDQIRESKDEEIIADMLSYMISDPAPASRKEYLDDYFGFEKSPTSTQRFNTIELATQRHTTESLISDFMRVYDEIRNILIAAKSTFGQLMFDSKPSRAPRYFQVLFLALHKLIVKQNYEINDMSKVVSLIRNSGNDITIKEGGKWGADDRENLVNSFAGRLESAFIPSTTYDPARVRWITQLENIFQQSHTEQAAYDFKQGFLRLDGKHSFDENSFEKILKTLVAIANIKKGTKGYVIVGVCDSEPDAKRVSELYKVKPTSFERFYITGIEHECKVDNKDLDQYFQHITNRISNSKLSDALKGYITRNIKQVRYYDKTVIVLESMAQEQPSSYDGKFFIRKATDVHEITDATATMELVMRYMAGY